MTWRSIKDDPPKCKRGDRIIGWCAFPAGAEAREIKCYIPLDRPDDEPLWFYGGIKQNVTHWMPLPEPPDA